MELRFIYIPSVVMQTTYHSFIVIRTLYPSSIVAGKMFSHVYQWKSLKAMTNDPQDAERDEYARFIKALGARIRALRKERGWTYRDMVVNHGFHLSAWQGFETARNGISLPSLLRVAKTFGMHPAELIADIPLEVLKNSGSTASAKGTSGVTRKRIGTVKGK